MRILFSLTCNREILEKLIQSVPKAGLASNTLLPCEDAPPPLDPKEYPQVRFWTAKSFEAYSDGLTGETDSMATQQKQRGRRRKSETCDDPHPYLENKDGSVVPREILVKVGQKARRVWQAMHAVGVAPSSWGKASEVAYKYFNSEMLNSHEFEFFRYCEGNWKITRWATKAYPSWAYNHIKSIDAGDNKMLRSSKRKRDLLDDPSLIQIDDDKNENVSPPSDPSPIESTSNVLASPAPSAFASVIQVCSHYM